MGVNFAQKTNQQEERSQDALCAPREETGHLYSLPPHTLLHHKVRACTQRPENWSPIETLYVPYLARNIKRLECLEAHCMYYLDGELGRKPKRFMFFPRTLLPMIEKYGDKLPNKQRIEKVVARLGGLMPKYIRTYALRQMLNTLGDNDVTRFILNKFGELTVSARHYRDLLEEADKIYPEYIQYIVKYYR